MRNLQILKKFQKNEFSLLFSRSLNWLLQSASTLGLAAGPNRLAVKYSELGGVDSHKVVLMEPKAFHFLMKRQKVGLFNVDCLCITYKVGFAFIQL